MKNSDDHMKPERHLWTSIWRGWRNRCPSCAKGRVLHSYVKVRDHCENCHEEFYHHRSDDGPAYFTILLVGHIVAPILLWVFTTYRPETWILLTGFLAFTLALSAYLLPRIKGAFVAFQWARFMYGFEPPKPQPVENS